MFFSVLAAFVACSDKDETEPDKPVDTPVDTPIDTPDEKPIDTPDDKPDDTPIDTPDDTPENVENGHEYVDLGLPSGALWSSDVLSVDGKKFFAWGEKEPK